jgi:hypothetical protein
MNPVLNVKRIIVSLGCYSATFLAHICMEPSGIGRDGRFLPKTVALCIEACDLWAVLPRVDSV